MARPGMFTYDPGFTSTASCESALTYIDGDEGVLLHRGYPIGQLPSTPRSWKSATCC
jgi:citrate synthase